MTMFFEGDLVSGTLALRNVQGMIATNRDRGVDSWSGHFHVTASDAAYLNNEDAYLLLLDNGQSARVVLNDWDRVPGSGELLQVCFGPA